MWHHGPRAVLPLHLHWRLLLSPVFVCQLGSSLRYHDNLLFKMIRMFLAPFFITSDKDRFELGKMIKNLLAML
jgi:hypothetical protein